MDDLSTRLRAAVSDAPPTRIDVDRLIRAERQRRRQVTRAWSGTGIAAAVAVVAVTPALVSGGPSSGPAVPPAPAPSATAVTPSPVVQLCAGVTPKPTGPQPPLQSYGTVRSRPTEEPTAGVARLTGALRDVLRTGLPAGVRAESLQRGCAEPQFQYHPSYREYEVGVRLRRGKDSGFFLLTVAPTATDAATPDCADAPGPGPCEIRRLPDGSVAMLSTVNGDPGEVQHWVRLTRPDGTSMIAITNNFRSKVVDNQMVSSATAAAPLLTPDQLVALARSPGLTLYP